MQNLKIISTASYHPPYSVTNQQLATIMDTSDEWIRTRTGIHQRYISKNENTSTLAFNVGKQLLAKSNIKASEIDLLIVATMSPDAYTPSTAAIVQGKLGADKAVSFDISAACTGFIYAVSTAEMMLKSSEWQTAMVIGAEVLSKLLNWKDRKTAVLFGDGAGGVILQKRKEAEPLILARDLRTFGNMAGKIVAGNTTSGATFPKQVTTLSPFEMAGRDVYRFATHEVPTSIISAVSKAQLQLNDIDYFLLHQANRRIIEQIAKRLNQPLNKFPVNIDEYGNTAAASEPILLAQTIADGLIRPGNIIAMSGFGGGLSTGTIILKY